MGTIASDRNYGLAMPPLDPGSGAGVTMCGGLVGLRTTGNPAFVRHAPNRTSSRLTLRIMIVVPAHLEDEGRHPGPEPGRDPFVQGWLR
jgi:hypothetical protein